MRGPEGLLFDIDGLNRHWNHNRQDYVIVSLLGRVKGKTLDRSHLLPCTTVTDSGISVKTTLRNLLTDKNAFGLKDGPDISDHEGKMYHMKDLDDMLHDVLTDIYSDNKDLFPVDILPLEKLKTATSVFALSEERLIREL